MGLGIVRDPGSHAFLEHIRTDPKLLGCSVTMPCKVAIIPRLDELTPEGAAIGAVNTLFLRNDESGKRIYCGTNTDCIGIREALVQNVSGPSIYRGNPALVVGGGPPLGLPFTPFKTS